MSVNTAPRTLTICQEYFLKLLKRNKLRLAFNLLFRTTRQQTTNFLTMRSTVYLSKANVPFSKQDLDTLVAISERRNKLIDITGYLCFFNNRFFQYIEGQEDDVEMLMEKIRADTRHRILYESDIEEIDRRAFTSWSMKQLKTKELSIVGLEACIEQSMHYINKNYYDKLRCDMYLWQQVRKASLIKDVKKMVRYSAV